METCKANLAAHNALHDDMDLNRPRFEDMDKLAAKLARGGSPDAVKIKQENQELQGILKKLDDDWKVRIFTCGFEFYSGYFTFLLELKSIIKSVNNIISIQRLHTFPPFGQRPRRGR